MLLIQLTGLSGAGKTTLANYAKIILERQGFNVEVIDGDIYRENICKDLGFSKEDRIENIRRLGFIGLTLARNNVITILAAINPFEEIRQELKNKADFVRTVWINCGLKALTERDTKGLYKRAFLPENDPNKLNNLTGVNDPYEVPQADLIVKTDEEDETDSANKLVEFILSNIKSQKAKEKSRAMFIGRWQPFHNGHKWLFDQKLKQGVPLLIAVRDVKPDEKNPLTTFQTVKILEKMYEKEDVEIIVIPDIESVNYGRGVGYEVNEFVPPEEISIISATETRRNIREGSEHWKANVDSKVQELVQEFLS